MTQDLKATLKLEKLTTKKWIALSQLLALCLLKLKMLTIPIKLQKHLGKALDKVEITTSINQFDISNFYK